MFISESLHPPAPVYCGAGMNHGFADSSLATKCSSDANANAPPLVIASFLVYWLTDGIRWRRAADRSQMMSPDTVSALFPDRPIRPLPKRRLRERLSPEAAESIQYPARARHTVPLFHYPPYSLKDRDGHGEPDFDTLAARPARNDGSSLTKLPLDAFALRSAEVGENATADMATPGDQATPSGRSTQAYTTLPPASRPSDANPPPSATSSIDGYDSFENTNNKKKRKIPSAGDSSISGAHTIGSDVNEVGLSNANVSLPESHGLDRRYLGTTSNLSAAAQIANSQGFSGPGRGRLGRSQTGRSPLRALPDGNNTWPLSGARTVDAKLPGKLPLIFSILHPQDATTSRLSPSIL